MGLILVLLAFCLLKGEYKMIIDVTGIKLTPGNFGKNCLGNGRHRNIKGKLLECCCDECGYMLCCLNKEWKKECLNCTDTDCPRNPSAKKLYKNNFLNRILKKLHLLIF